MTQKDSSVYAGQSKQERQQVRHQQLIQAGIEAFGLDGYHACTVREICKRAELSHRYFYESFEDMEGLFLAVYSHCVTDMEQRLIETFHSSSGESSIEKIIEKLLFEFYSMVEDERIVRICCIDILGVGSAADALYSEKVASFANLLRVFLSMLFPTFKTDPDILDVLAISVVGSVEQSAIFWYLNKYSTPKEKMVLAQSLIVSGVLTSLKNHSTQP